MSETRGIGCRATRWARGAIGILIGALLAIAIAAAPASASSLVFVKGNNVWLANPDGSGQYQVTLDGTASNPYMYPTQATDGTIMAQRGKGGSALLYRMSQNGTLEAQPFGTAAGGSGPIEPVITPDGSKVVWYWVGAVNGCYPYNCPGTATAEQISDATKFTDPSVYDPYHQLHDNGTNPNWIGNTRLLLPGGSMWIWDLYGSTAQQWFSWWDIGWRDKYGNDAATCFVSGNLYEGALSPDGKLLAVVDDPTSNGSGSYPQCDPGYWNQVGNDAYIIVFKTSGDATTGNPSAKPTAECKIDPPDGTNGFPGGAPAGTAQPNGAGLPLFDSVSWAPNASAIAFEYNGDTYVATIGSADCSTGWTVTKVIAGGTHPFWGPANINPAARPSGTGGGTGTSGGGTGTSGGGTGTSGGGTGTSGGGSGTSGGTSAACHVPKILGKTLAAAERAIGTARCKVGKVTRKRTARKRKGRVLSESPRAGTRLPVGAKVNLVVGR